MEEAADRIAAMKTAGDGLLPFMRSCDDCTCAGKCDCGLTDAIQKWKDASHD